jgi:tetratricopeptide (TPR) repeat protein
MLVWALAAARRRRLWSFAVIWFLGNLVIESSVVGLELVFEHRTYLPAVFLYLAVCRPLLAPGRTLRLRSFAVAGMVLLSALGSWQRNQVWRDEVTLRRDCVRKAPAKARPHAILAGVLARAGRPAEAAREYRAALRLERNPARAAMIAYNLANLYMAAGRYPEAEAIYRKIARERPRMFLPRLNLGVLLMRENRLREAERLHRRLVGDFPDEYRAHLNYGILLDHLGRKAEAAAQFRRVLELDPGNREAARRLAAAAGS